MRGLAMPKSVASAAAVIRIVSARSGCVSAAGTSESGMCTVAGTTCDILGLTPETTYHFTVTARNSAGSGPASSPAADATIANVPDAPTGVGGISNDGAVTVNWTAPANNGSAITGYTVTASGVGAQTCTTATTSCQVTGLTNGTPYTFTVVATNAMGNSAPSAASASTKICFLILTLDYFLME